MSTVSSPRVPWWRKRATSVVAGVTVAALVVTGAVIAQGYDAQELPRVENSVWVTRDAGQYARVNTDLGEIDTVRSVDDPSSVAQYGSDAVVFGQSDRQFWTVDPAVPADLVVDASSTEDGREAPAETATATPAGTRLLTTAGDYALALTELGSVFLGRLSDPDAGFSTINPFAGVEVAEGEEPPVYTANAASVGPDGDVVLFSAEEGGIRRYDAAEGDFTGDLVEIASPPDASEPVTMTMVGSHWVLHAPGEQLVWIDGGGEPSATGLGADALLQSPSGESENVWLSDSTGIVPIELSTGEAGTAAGGGSTPAAPVVIDGVAYGAWLGEDGGTLFASDTGEVVALETQEDILADVSTIIPVLRSNGQRAVLNELATGMLWTVPDGRLIPVEQWNIENNEDVEDSTVVVDDADEQEPPTAVADSFGVRAGSLVSLPLLFNDHDPNRSDVLTIDRGSLSGLSDGGFGSLGLVGNSQTATVRVQATSGSASFSYSASDGTAVSSPVAVTLTVVPPEVNSAPVWCGVDACVQTWPTPVLAPGGTITVPVLNGWVDPEGDSFVLADVRKATPSDPIAVVATADGSVAISHTDPNAPGGTMVITVVLMDSYGATVEKDIAVTVSSAPQLDLKPTAMTVAVSELATITVADVVSSGSGSYRLVDAVDASATPGVLTVAPNSSLNSIDVSAPTAGEYLVSYAVQDTVTLAEKTGAVRITVVPVSQTIAVAPLTAFVRPGEDVTVGVLEAVQNSTGRVLIVASATPRQPQLTASVVSQSNVRVRGTTADGLPGPIGTVGVSITDGLGTFVEGEITVFLVQPARDISPIAVPDTVTVRAGAQVDIPVLANDVSPRGEKLAIAPGLVTSDTPGELAFVSSDSLRYLAPAVPGTYSVTYSAYLEGAPDRLAAAPVTITVLAPGSNRAPQPRTLVGRALAGGTAEIPVPLTGADPDGDSVALVSVTQPAAGEGSASISADGTSLVYRAPADGVADGQTSFTYTLRDSGGESARGTVRVGVLTNETADMTPLTFSTQIRAQAGSTTPLTVLPLLTDSDPAGGTLELIEVVPNAPANAENPEYARLESLIDPATDLEKGIVSLRAGDVIGSHSYVYTVQSSKTSSTAQGLIVVGVSESVAPDRPVVVDTTVNLVNRTQLQSGVDVVTDKIQWVSGDPATLELSVWGDAAEKYTAEGGRISGPLPRAGTIVPFQLSGTDSGGEPIVSYGFLRIPPLDDMRVQSRTTAADVTVNEEATAEIDVQEFVLIGADDELEVRGDEPFSVQRANATCKPGEGTTITYSAGREAPWRDTCTASVRVEGQSTWTMVTIPIAIIPKDPQAILGSITRTVAPGSTEAVDLYANMTTWEGDREGDRSKLDYSISHGGSSFIVTQQGESVSIEARADAVPGTRESVTVSVSAFGGLSATISLIVGIAPPDAPKGASFAHQCTVSAGPSCSIPAVGLAGEYDPFAGKTGGGLKVVAVTSQSCPVASISVGGDTNLIATWPSGVRPAGGDCTATFEVKDAQGRSGLGELRLDVLGYPAAPSSVVTTNFGPTWVELSVTLGEASLAHPELTGVVIYEGGSQVSASCTPGTGAYICRVNGMTHGEHRFFTARAVNSVGESVDTTPHETWSYDFPQVNSVSGTAVYDPGLTSQTAGAVDLSISAGPTATEFRVLVDGGVVATFASAGPTTSNRIKIEGTGSRTVTVEPSSGTVVPPIPRAHDGSKAASVVVAGSPSISAGGSPSSTPSSVTMQTPGTSANGSTTSYPVIYGISTSGGLSCSGSPTGAPGISGATTTQASGAFGGLASNTRYYVIACFGNGFGIAATPVQDAFTWQDPGSPSGNLTYTVQTVATDNGGGYFTWSLATGPSPDPAPPGYTLEWPNGVFPSVLDPNSVPSGYTVQYCIVFVGLCGTQAPITLAGGPPTAITVQFPTSCTAPLNPLLATPAEIDTARAGIVVSSAASSSANRSATWDAGTWTYSVSFNSPFNSAEAVSFACTP